MPILKDSTGRIILHEDAILKGDSATWSTDVACCCGEPEIQYLIIYKTSYDCATSEYTTQVIYADWVNISVCEFFETLWGDEGEWHHNPTALTTEEEEAYGIYFGASGECVYGWWQCNEPYEVEVVPI